MGISNLTFESQSKASGWDGEECKQLLHHQADEGGWKKTSLFLMEKTFSSLPKSKPFGFLELLS